MRLSDVKGGRVLDVVADLVEPVAAIASDDDAAAMFKREECPEGMTPMQFFAQRVRAGIPALLRNHKADVVAILATIEGTTPEEYEEGLTLAKLMVDVAELMTDEAFTGFLASSETKTEGAASGE